MPVVSNTSPISHLSTIGRLDLLRSRFEHVWIPYAVAKELQRLPRPAARAAIEQAYAEGWLKKRAAPASTLEMRAEWLLLDETDGRKCAVRNGLNVIGVLGILLAAKQRGEIPLVKPELESLRTIAQFFIDAPLEKQVLAAAGE